MSRSPLLVVLVIASLAMAQPAAGQEATPAALPATPAPAECQVEPRPISFFEPVIQRALASPLPVPTDFVPGRVVTPAPVASPAGPGRPADPATVAAVTATAREAIACLNAGDGPRYLALLSDQTVREGIAFLVSGQILRLRPWGEATPTP